jgi:hypothetical protein
MHDKEKGSPKRKYIVCDGQWYDLEIWWWGWKAQAYVYPVNFQFIRNHLSD